MDNIARMKVLKRDNYTCVDCHTHEKDIKLINKLNVHHKNKIPNDNRMCNMVTLCPKCHAKRHRWVKLYPVGISISKQENDAFNRLVIKTCRNKSQLGRYAIVKLLENHGIRVEEINA